MKLEDQVCSLKYAKRLKELGVKQKSLFYWVSSRWDKTGNKRHRIHEGIPEYAKGEMGEKYNFLEINSAFTASELGEMLPEKLIHIENGNSGKKYEVELEFYTNFKECWYENEDKTCPCGCGTFFNKSLYIGEDKTEVNARTKMLIYLLENKLIKLNDK